MKKIQKTRLPIDDFLDDIVSATNDYQTILVKASPGSGKTTRLPWSLVQRLKLKVAVLEPRRLAAKLAAIRVATEEELTIGREVGYHFRLEKKISHETELTFFTEGTFLKRFLSDPLLSGIDILILDEFHERHLETDLALALASEVQKKRGLKIILMSATLDLKLIEAFPEARIFDINAPFFPVEVTFLPNIPSVLDQSLEIKVKKSIAESDGDTLVFLPGMREMLRVQSVLSKDLEVFLLHSDLSREEQESALAPSSRRKIILATNIAESSVTIPGIRTVIDSGIQRSAFYSPWTGLKFIKDYPITQSSANQRTGRAGRTGPGQCIRLFSQTDYQSREEHTLPEIKKADLTDTALFLLSSGLSPNWFEKPDEDKIFRAKKLLELIGALKSGSITEIGTRLLDYPLEARLARVLLEGEDLILESKKKLIHFICSDLEDDRSGMLLRRLQFYLFKSGNSSAPWEKCLLTGFIDQVALYRSKYRDFIHYSGKILKAHGSLNHLVDGFYIIFDITQRQEAVKVMEFKEEWAFELDPFPFSEEEEIEVSEIIQLKRKTKLGSIVIEEDIRKFSWHDSPPSLHEKIISQTSNLMVEKIKIWKESQNFLRISFWCKELGKDLDSAINQVRTEDFLELYGLHWENFPLFIHSSIEKILDLKRMDQELPREINLGGRRNIVVHYPLNQGPFVEAPIQEFYGQKETPTIMNGKVSLTLRLLGPHKRPVQITSDLAGFWRKTYQEMKKEYQKEYPRHYWPEIPWEARPYLLKSHLPKT